MLVAGARAATISSAAVMVALSARCSAAFTADAMRIHFCRFWSIAEVAVDAPWALNLSIKD